MFKSITSSSIPTFPYFKRGPDSSLWEQSLGLAWLGPHGSWGFSPVGGNRLYSEGEPVRVLSTKGKEDCPELLTVLAVNLKENYLLDPCVVSSNPLWGGRFSSSNICARTNGPPERKPPLRREHQKVWCARSRRGTLPFHGVGSLGLNAPEDQLWKERANKKKTKKKNCGN